MEIRMIALDQIVEDEAQPRREFDQESLQGLADSLKQHGMLQPITVRPLHNVNMYQIITGERRWRAAQLAEMGKVPCVVKEVEADEILTEQLIENMQREDLQPLDKAKALNTVKQKLMVTNKELAQRLGLSERAISNLLAIMNLPDEIGEKIVASPNRPAEGRLTEKHARHLRQLNDDPEMQTRIVDKIERERLSGDEAGRLIGEIKRRPERADTLLESGGEALVEMPERKMSGPAAKVTDFCRYLQGLELKRLSRKQLEDLKASLKEMKSTADVLLEEAGTLDQESEAVTR